MTSVWKSRVLWTAIADFIFTVAGILVAHFLMPGMQELVKAVLIAAQGVVAILIAAFTVEGTVAAYLAAKVQIAKLQAQAWGSGRDPNFK